MKIASILAVLVLSMSSCFAADEKVSSEDFLRVVRNPPRNESWAMLSGKISHRGAKRLKADLYLGLKFTPIQTQAQVILNGKEGYSVGQFYEASSDSSTVMPLNDGVGYNPSLLAGCGVAPDDLTMSFLYWGFVAELEAKTVRTFDSRVFVLKNSEYDSTDAVDDKYAKVSISTEYFFPVKVEWFKNDLELKSGVVHRTMEIQDFTREDDFWLVDELQVFGDGWITKIDFKESKAGYSKESVPKDLFRELR